jgi:hypothetical protein
MTRGVTFRVLAAATLLGAVACSDVLTTDDNTVALSPAFQTVPAGFSANSSTFDESGDDGSPFLPGVLDASTGFHRGDDDDHDNRGHGNGADRDDHDFDDDRHGFGGRRIRGLLMGGGLGKEFVGVFGFGRGRGRGPFGNFNLPSVCIFDETTGRVTCPDKQHHGFTVTSSWKFTDAAGVEQPKFDTLTTDTVNILIGVTGTKTRHDGTTTSTVDHMSDRTVAGLAPDNTERVVNGVARAHETTTGTRDGVAFTAERLATDTTTNVVIPIEDGRPTIPTAGTIVRTMLVTITKEGSEPRTKSRREVVTFDGTNVIDVTITQDGVTKDCSITLPRKKLVCES